MSILIARLSLSALFGFLATEAAAQGYLQFRPQTGGNMVWILVGVAGGVGAVLLLMHLYSRMTEQRQKAPVKAAQKKRGVDFNKHAAKLGFKIGEIKTLRLIAGKIASHDPDSLLATDAGRERLSADVWERVRRREREVQFLRGILNKLEVMRDKGIRERATIRVEANLPVWIVKKADEVAQESDEDLFTEVEQVGGRLLDLSEGGAAVTAELTAETNDIVELWSADPEVWIPPITAGVLSVERGDTSRPPVLHLHFIDPPLGELRVALQALQRDAGQAQP